MADHSDILRELTRFECLQDSLEDIRYEVEEHGPGQADICLCVGAPLCLIPDEASHCRHCIRIQEDDPRDARTILAEHKLEWHN